MGTLIFTWDPNAWKWEPSPKKPNQKRLVENIEEIATSIKKETIEEWNLWSYTKVRPGDTAYIAIIGKGKKGIIGRGVISEDKPFEREDWRNNSKELRWYVNIKINALLDPNTDEIMAYDYIKEKIPAYKTPRRCGTLINPLIADELNKLWMKHSAKR
jgi:hypothetical protein